MEGGGGWLLNGTWFLSQLSNATYRNIVGPVWPLCCDVFRHVGWYCLKFKFNHFQTPNSVAIFAVVWPTSARLKPYLDLKGKASVNIHSKSDTYLSIRSLIAISRQLRKLPKHIVIILSELRSELQRNTQLICATADAFRLIT